MTCPRCGNPAIYMASEEFKLLDCEFCDDVIDVRTRSCPSSSLSRPKIAGARKGGWFRSRRGLPAPLLQAPTLLTRMFRQRKVARTWSASRWLPPTVAWSACRNRTSPWPLSRRMAADARHLLGYGPDGAHQAGP